MEIKTHILSEPFHLESGIVINDIPIGYSTAGKLNLDKSNVVLVCHALTANSKVDDWWSGLYGKDNVFDPDQHFIICINNMGSPYGSWSPKSIDRSDTSILDFPFYTIRDTVNLHLALLSALEITSIDLVIGGSCGGNVAMEIAYTMREQINQLVLMCCSAKETPWVISIHESQRIALHSDPTFGQEHGGKGGLRGARAFALPFYRSHASFKIRQTEADDATIRDFKAAAYVRYQGDKFVDRYDPYCYYHQLHALDTHNIGRDRGGAEKALSDITADTLCIGFSTDLLIPVIEQQFLADNISVSKYIEIETDFGHDAFLIETDQLKKHILYHRTKSDL